MEERMKKEIVLTEITEILDHYCEGCLVKKQLIEERGKTGAHRFCIKTCTIGEQLKFLGAEMNKWTK